MIDVNVYLSRWPTRRLPFDETPRLADMLRAKGVAQAWVGSFDALLHKDIAAVNHRLAAECQQLGDQLFLPFGAVNPTLPDWRDDVKRCREKHGMRGIRLHPNYHGYQLDDPRFAELLDLCDRQQLIVQIAVRMEDTRTQHRLLRVGDVDTSPLEKLLPARPKLRVVILNGLRTLRPDAIERLASAGQVYFDIAMQEGVGGIEQLLSGLSHQRVLFGSYAPFFYFESAELKMRESPLANFQRTAIETENARRLLVQAPNE